MRTLWQDLRHGLRMWRRKPGVTAVVLLTLVIGLGANTAIFSVANAVLFHALPFADDEQLVRLYDVRRRDDGQISQVSMSPRNFHEVREQAAVFESVAAQIFLNLNLASGEGVERIVGIGVSEEWLSTLGVAPMLGRGFSGEEEAAGTDSRAALISRGFWLRRFGADPAAIGAQLPLDLGSYTVIGILPEGFDYPYRAEVWLPHSFDRGNGRSHPLNVQARLKPGIAITAAQAELDAIAGRLALAYPETNAGYQLRAVRLRDVLIEGRGRLVMVLVGAVGFLLLVACANVANLLLAQAIARRREFAIRVGLGASRARQMRQLLTENLMLSLIGGAGGLLLTVWVRGLLLRLLPPDLTYVMREVPISPMVLGFALLASVLVGVVIGLAPVLRATRLDVNSVLKEGGRSGAGMPGERLLRALVVGEIATAVVLLAGAGLMFQNLVLLERASLGIATDHLLTLKLALPEREYAEPTQRAELARRLIEQVETVPGVVSATMANLVPLTSGNVTTAVVPEGKVFDPNEQLVASYRVVSPRYFETLQLPLRSGRAFSARDDEGAPPIAIVSHSMAQRYWPGADPVGRRVRTQRGETVSAWMTVVGVAGEVEETTASREVRETLYIPLLQDAASDRTWATSSVQVAIRTAVEPMSAVPSLRSAIRQVDKNLPVFDIATAEQLYGDALAQTRVSTILLLCFSGFGLLLAALGTYGVFSYLVSRREREIGIRIALGAVVRDVLRLVMRQGAILALTGVGIGLVGAAVLTRFMAGVLSEIRPGDPRTLALVAGFLIAVALLACYVPARRAMKVDPMAVLRNE